jgi:hypothetical protein
MEQQTKDFVKFLSLVVIIYLGERYSREASSLALAK